MTTFEAYKYVGPLRHLDSMSLLSLRDGLRDEKLSVERPRRMGDGETVMIGAGTVKLVTVVNVERIKDGVYPLKTSVEDAMDFHIAANIVLKERGFTAKIDAPEITIELP